MKKTTTPFLAIVLLGSVLIASNSFGQSVSINSTGVAADPESILDVSSTTKGVLLPRVANHTSIVPTNGSDDGLMVYDTTTDSYWYWDATANTWREIPNTSGIVTTLDGAYDGGGSGAGRTITADNGAVNIAGTDGLTVNGNVGIGTLTPNTKLRVNSSTNGLTVPLVVRNSASNTVGDVVGIGLVNEQVEYGNFFKVAMVSERTAGFGVGKLHFLVDGATDANSAALTDSKLTIQPDGNVGIGSTTPSAKLYVNGNASITGKFNSNGIQESSDARFKKDITRLESPLQKLLQIEGVSYRWKIEEFPTRNFNDGVELGVIAQDLEKIYPELVATDAEGYKSVQYSHLVPVLIEAIKEQQAIINTLNERVDYAANQYSELQSKLVVFSAELSNLLQGQLTEEEKEANQKALQKKKAELGVK